MSVSSHPARAEAERFARFCVVGVSNTVLTLVSFAALAAVGIPAAAASALGFAVGAANGYVLNRSWTFRSSRRGAATVARYVAVQAAGAACSAGGVALAAADLSLRRILAEACVLPFATALTYTLSRRLVFGAGVTAGALMRSDDRRTGRRPARRHPSDRPIARSLSQVRQWSIRRPHPARPTKEAPHGTASP